MNQKPDAGYGYVLCEVTDKNRTHWWCGHYEEWCDGNKGTGHRGHICGIEHNRKPVPIPEGWEMVPEGDVLRAGDETLFRTGKCMPLEASVGKVARDAYVGGRTVYAACFIRRKSPEAPKQEHAPQSTGWVSTKERMPNSVSVKCVITDGDRHDLAIYDPEQKWWAPRDPSLINPMHVTHWMPLPPPPAPEKTEAELAWEDLKESTGYHSPKNERNDFGFFNAGFKKGKESQWKHMIQ